MRRTLIAVKFLILTTLLCLTPASVRWTAAANALDETAISSVITAEERAPLGLQRRDGFMISEPSTLLLMGLALLGFSRVARRNHP